MTKMNDLIAWFLPAGYTADRSANELARIFIFTHLFGPLIAQPMNLYLYYISPSLDFPLVVMSASICSFWALPFVFQRTGNLQLSAFLSFQLLGASALFGAYFYGGFSSPFLPWLTVSLLLGLFYLSNHQAAVVGFFVVNVTMFLGAVAVWGIPSKVDVEDLSILGWLSITAAAIYMAWMAIYYSKIMALRDDLRSEAEKYQATTRQLERARELAKASKESRDKFFAKMSHELRTPLNAIIGYSEILLEDAEMEPQVNATRSSDIARIHSAGKHLLSLVSEVLEADGFETALLRTQIATFGLGTLCDEVAATGRASVEANGNRFLIVCPQREASVTLDQTKLRQMMLNLLSNAGKFTKDGTVQLEIRMNETKDRRLVIAVSDTGIGIDPAVLPRLGTDYEQADASISGAYGGTGLGLALTRKLAVLLGGELRIESRRGVGSTFTIDLPSVYSADTASVRETEPAARPTTQRMEPALRTHGGERVVAA